jgi:hypothetical protein
MQAGERVRELRPEGLAARFRPQHRQHKQLPVRQDHLGCRHAAELAQGGQPFGLRDEDVAGRRVDEGLDEHRRRVPADGYARERRDPARRRLHCDDIAHPGPEQALQQERRRAHHDGPSVRGACSPDLM